MFYTSMSLSKNHRNITDGRVLSACENKKSKFDLILVGSDSLTFTFGAIWHCRTAKVSKFQFNPAQNCSL
jgi:hypothetical protein